MLGEVLDLDNLDAVDLIADDKSVLGKVVQAGIDVQSVTRKEVNPNLLGLVEQPPFTVRERPQAGEEHADPDVTFAEFRVREKARLDVSGAGHHSPPLVSNQKRTRFSLTGNSNPTLVK